jgi:hypothetical protein
MEPANRFLGIEVKRPLNNVSGILMKGRRGERNCEEMVSPCLIRNPN